MARRGHKDFKGWQKKKTDRQMALNIHQHLFMGEEPRESVIFCSTWTSDLNVWPAAMFYIYLFILFIFSLCKTVVAAGVARLFLGVAAAILRHPSSSTSHKAIQIYANVCRCLSCQFECEYISSSDEVRIQTINHQAYFISRFSASLFFFRSVSGSWRNYETAGTIKKYNYTNEEII